MAAGLSLQQRKQLSGKNSMHARICSGFLVIVNDETERNNLVHLSVSVPGGN